MATKKASDAAEAATAKGAEAVTAGFEKATKTFERAAAFNKGAADAYTQSATLASKSAEQLQSEFMAYSKKSVEKSMAAAKAVMGAKSLPEALELQSAFIREAFESYITQMSRMGELMMAANKDAMAPLQEHFGEAFQMNRFPT